jgi:RNA polymerase sigma factor (sigma-70 family)
MKRGAAARVTEKERPTPSEVLSRGGGRCVHGVVTASDERELVARLKRQDPLAFDEVYAQYRARLFGFLARLCRRRDLADDLLQETWLRLATHAPRLTDDTRLAAWLYTVARNVYRSHRRWSMASLEARGWLSRESFAAVERTSPFDLASASELERRLELALGALPLAYREVLLLVAVERLEPMDAAAVLGLRPDALRQRLARGRAMLADELGRLERARQSTPTPVAAGGTDVV